ncbi:Clavaminate synthase-like protein [Polyplosphaeria fusca]|uniref:Clavaminate synthase-like protein n=1 Tax=Polyplosphaeria fusca TaxID=682080 RepID=A0A9P4QX40_9PLEO|nr:Clavaminate synthase-like protein [Polyplosphaeria fusca]
MTAATAPPTLREILELTREQLITAQDDDPIAECGFAPLSILQSHPQTVLRFAYQKLYHVPYKEVKDCWRRLYMDAALWNAMIVLERHLKLGSKITLSVGQGHDDWITQIVEILDKAMITVGSMRREELVQLWFEALGHAIKEQEQSESTNAARPSKRRKLSDDDDSGILDESIRNNTPSADSPPEDPLIPSTFPTTITHPPTLHPSHLIPRLHAPSFTSFAHKLSHPSTHTPAILTSTLTHWPALTTRPWTSPGYLLTHTLSGRRLIPIELGSTYTSPTWTQLLLPFRTFLHSHLLSPSGAAPGYLAQHALFTHLPTLYPDIVPPDYIHISPHPHLPPNIHLPVQQLQDPVMNVWLGPPGTVSPLHTDPWHNLLAQVFGEKYVRLYGPGESGRMFARGRDERGVDMGNTSEVEMEEFWGVGGGEDPFREGKGGKGEEEEEGVEAKRREFEERFPGFKDAEYVEGVLGPGECLYIPPGWWHYVRSLSVSCSVNFWWN